jgi:hypothetical protein
MRISGRSSASTPSFTISLNTQIAATIAQINATLSGSERGLITAAA